MTSGLLARLRELRRDGQVVQARAMLAASLRDKHDDKLAFLAWQHAPFWWDALRGAHISLVRRGPDDVELVRRCWDDVEFMSRFNRLAVALPASDAALKTQLVHEHWALAEESRALHWTIHAGSDKVGFVSLVDIAFGHRRAEFLIGVLPGTHPWIAPEAAHLGLEFAARQLKLERLSAYFYPENTAAMRVAEKLGFEREGLLRSYLRLPGAAARADMVVAGLLLDDAFFARTSRLRQRLLGRP